MVCQTTLHQAFINSLIRYLKATMNATLKIEPDSETQLCARVDVSLSREPGSGRISRTGMVINYGGLRVYNASLLQKSKGPSLTEA